jgi:hypothetical protein
MDQRLISLLTRSMDDPWGTDQPPSRRDIVLDQPPGRDDIDNRIH